MELKQSVLIIHRRYRNLGGEDAFLKEILEPALHSLSSKAQLTYSILEFPPLFSRSGIFTQISDFLELLFMSLGFERLRPSYRTCQKSILKHMRTSRNLMVVLNNVIPTVSLQVPAYAKKEGCHVLMWVHNSRIFCANGLMFNGVGFCEKCRTSGSRWSLFQNCHRNMLQSFIYALTYRSNRVPAKILSCVDRFICNSEFSKKIITETASLLNFKPGRSRGRNFQHRNVPVCDVILMPTSSSKLAPRLESRLAPTLLARLPTHLSTTVAKIPKPFYLFLGRVSFEKGADIFRDLAKQFPDRGFLLCGEGPLLQDLKIGAPQNLAFGGSISEGKEWLFKNCEAVIIPSRVAETASLVITESDPYDTPVVYPTGGGAEEYFKALNRHGCTLKEFQGQLFRERGQKRVPPQSARDHRAEFDSKLLGIFNSTSVST